MNKYLLVLMSVITLVSCKGSEPTESTNADDSRPASISAVTDSNPDSVSVPSSSSYYVNSLKKHLVF